MPSLATLQAFAATVEANDHVGAITKFYAPDAQTQENNNPPIAGRDVYGGVEVEAGIVRVEGHVALDPRRVRVGADPQRAASGPAAQRRPA